MFSTVLSTITGTLDKRFIMSIFFPCLVFLGLFTSLSVYMLTGDLVQTVKNLTNLNAEIQGGAIILFLAITTFCAYFLAGSITPLLRLYEGYWDWIPWHELFAIRLQKYHQNQLAALQKQLNDPSTDDKVYKQCYQEMFFYYPPSTRPQEVMPTRLGNIFKSVELYPKMRYNMDAIFIWPRLAPLLPQGFSDALADTEASLDLMLVASFLGYLLACIGLVMLILLGLGISHFKLEWYPFLSSIVGGLLVGWLGYLGVLKASLAFGLLIRSAFDLYRNTIIQALGLKAPTCLREERVLWEAIDQYLYRGIPVKEEAFEYASTNDAKKESK